MEPVHVRVYPRPVFGLSMRSAAKQLF